MKKRKIFKKITLAGLAACMFCLPILAGCAPAEMLPQKPTQGQNFDLGLNPETDPVVYTTASGLQIKKSDGKYSSTTTTTTNKGNTYTQDLRGFYYFTMGTFSGTIYTSETIDSTYTVTNERVNWLIIGKGPGFNFESNTPAGSAIQGDVNKQEMAFSNSMYESIDLSSIPQHSDIPQGCFLVLSEKLLGNMYFNSSGALNAGIYTGNPMTNILQSKGVFGNNYLYYGSASTETNGKQSWNKNANNGGSLYNYINSLMCVNKSTGLIMGDNNLNFTQAQADLIVPQQLYTFYSNGDGYPLAETPSSDGGTYYTMFPLAARDQLSTYQNFCIEDFFSTQENIIASLIGTNLASYWWLRTGAPPYTANAYSISPNGGCSYHNSVSNVYGVRPAMVMKLS